MRNNMMNEKEAADMAMWASLAAAGGVARFLTGRLEAGAPKLQLRTFMFLLGANIFVSGFSGLMGAMAMSTVTPETTWQSISAGVFGFLGAKGLEMLADKVNNKIQP